MTERATLTVSTSSWHGRAYAYWRQHAKHKTVGYRENLCHYCRVVLFWAPFAWFMHAGGEFIRPVTVFLAAVLVAGVTAAFLLAPGGTLATLGVLAVAVALCGVLGLAFWLTDGEVGWW